MPQGMRVAGPGVENETVITALTRLRRTGAGKGSRHHFLFDALFARFDPWVFALLLFQFLLWHCEIMARIFLY